MFETNAQQVAGDSAGSLLPHLTNDRGKFESNPECQYPLDELLEGSNASYCQKRKDDTMGSNLSKYRTTRLTYSTLTRGNTRSPHYTQSQYRVR